jgi:hypothetical protein
MIGLRRLSFHHPAVPGKSDMPLARVTFTGKFNQLLILPENARGTLLTSRKTHQMQEF